ncbi:MAG: N-acetylmuramoyl-L-alanine amidase [Ignavibacteriae bacterium]|nr:N-acetylmuramoyl-L-alanine amidase [Ignavibacteriota bacterium]
MKRRAGENGGRRLAQQLAQSLCILLLTASSLLAQTIPIKIILDTQSTSAAMRSVRQSGIDYGALADLAKALGFATKENLQARSLSVQLPARHITFFAQNTFVILNDKTTQKATTFQIPSPLLSRDSTLYFPVAACAPLFDRLLGVSGAFVKGTLVLTVGKKPAAAAFDIPLLTLEPKANGMLIRIAVAKPITGYESLLQKDGWLYVTIPKAKADVAALNKIRPVGAVKKIVAIQSATSVQLTFKLDGAITSSEVIKDEASNDLLVMLRGLSDETLAEYERRKRATEQLSRERKKHLLDVVVLDAGHGGKDPGTIGVTGTKEKTIALSVVLKLGKLIEKNLKDVNVVYTRDDDTFVELYRRGQIANEADGKLFISIHCNSTPRKGTAQRGFEVYLLRPGRTDEAIEIAERENSVIELEESFEQRYKKLTDENFILVTMAQTAHMRGSEMFAEIAAKEMDKHLITPSKGVRQAGFYVLVGSAMPNVLIETGYLSNREEEKYLKLDSTHQKYAEAIFNAIKRYKMEYEKLLLEGEGLGKN